MKQRSGWAGGCGVPMRAHGGRVNGAGGPAYADGGEVDGVAPTPRLDRPQRIAVKIGAAPAVPAPAVAAPAAAPAPNAGPVMPPMGGMPMNPTAEKMAPMGFKNGGPVMPGGAGGGLYRMKMQNKK